MADHKSIPVGFCQCGCGHRTRVAAYSDRSKGHVKGQPLRYLTRHNLKRDRPGYILDDATGCWNYQGHINREGYASCELVNGRNMAASRAYYVRSGRTIPSGLELDHLCRNRRCVNPDHMEPVTGTENRRRKSTTKLNVQAIREIRALGGTMRHEDIATKFGVCREHISDILAGRSWKDLPEG